MKRVEKIIYILEREIKVDIDYLTKSLNVSEMTVRRDLDILEKKGIITRITHGAQINRGNIFQTEYLERMEKNVKEKIVIARKGVEHISKENSIIICHGTTTYQLAKLLRNTNFKLRVITNALDLAMELTASENIDTIILGGHVNKFYNVEPSIGCEIFNSENPIDIMFIGADGIELNYGLTSFSIRDVEMNKNMMQYVKKIIVLIDSSKFGKVRYGRLLPLDKISVLITDSNIDKETIEKYRSKNVNIIIANVDEI